MSKTVTLQVFVSEDCLVLITHSVTLSTMVAVSYLVWRLMVCLDFLSKHAVPDPVYNIQIIWDMSISKLYIKSYLHILTMLFYCKTNFENYLYFTGLENGCKTPGGGGGGGGGSYEEGYRRSLQEEYDWWKTFGGQPIHEHCRKELSSVECSSHHVWCPQPTPFCHTIKEATSK